MCRFSPRRTLSQRFFGRVPPVSGVSHDATEEAGIRRRYPVVPVNVELCQGRDVDAEGALAWYGGYQPGVQPVDTLDDDDVIGAKLDRLARLPPTGVKVKARELHDFSLHQGQQVLVE